MINFIFRIMNENAVFAFSTRRDSIQRVLQRTGDFVVCWLVLELLENIRTIFMRNNFQFGSVCCHDPGSNWSTEY